MPLTMHHILIYVGALTPKLKGWYKTWTLDSGLDHGLDYGLHYGLDFGVSWTVNSVLELLFKECCIAQ